MSWAYKNHVGVWYWFAPAACDALEEAFVACWTSGAEVTVPIAALGTQTGDFFAVLPGRDVDNYAQHSRLSENVRPIARVSADGTLARTAASEFRLRTGTFSSGAPFAVPAHLSQAISNGDCVAVVGAGFAAAQRFPTWVSLLEGALEAAADQGLVDRGDMAYTHIASLLGVDSGSTEVSPSGPTPELVADAARKLREAAAELERALSVASAATMLSASSTAGSSQLMAAAPSPVVSGDAVTQGAAGLSQTVNIHVSSATPTTPIPDATWASVTVSGARSVAADVRIAMQSIAPPEPAWRAPTMDDLWHAAQALEEVMTHDGLVESFRQKLVVAQANINDAMKERLGWLQQIPLRAVITTNFDSLLQGPTVISQGRAAFGHILRAGNSAAAARYWSNFEQQIHAVHASMLAQTANQASSPASTAPAAVATTVAAAAARASATILHNHTVIKLHGDVESGCDVVVTRDGYRDLLYGTPQYASFMKALMASSTLLYLGFSFTDVYINEIRQEVMSMLDFNADDVVAGMAPPLGYAIMNDFPESKKRYWLMHEGIQVLSYDTRGPKPDCKEFQVWNGFNYWLEAIHEHTSPIPRLGSLLYEKRVLVLAHDLTIPHESTPYPDFEQATALIAAARRSDWDWILGQLETFPHLVNTAELETNRTLLHLLVDSCKGDHPAIDGQRAVGICSALIARGAAGSLGARPRGQNFAENPAHAARGLVGHEFVPLQKLLESSTMDSRIRSDERFSQRGTPIDAGYATASLRSAQQPAEFNEIQTEDLIRLLQAADMYAKQTRAVGFVVDVATTVSEALTRHAADPYSIILCRYSSGAVSLLSCMHEQRLLRVPMIVFGNRDARRTRRQLVMASGASNYCETWRALMSSFWTILSPLH